MTRGRTLITTGALLLALAGCGDDGGGGDEAAFCDALDDLSGQVTDGDVADDIDGVVDTVNALIATAPDGAPLEAAQALGDEVADADEDDEGDVADVIELVQDELGPQAEDLCGEDPDEFAVAPEGEATTTTTEPDTTTTTTGGDDTTTTTAGDGEEGDSPPVGAREPVPGDIAPEFASLAQACFDGDMESCDTLFADTPPGSIDEAYGDTCAGRIDDGQGFTFLCATAIQAAIPAADAATALGEVQDPAFAAQSDACFAGDQVACDELFTTAPDPSFERTYGAVCGGRVPTATVLCVDILGEDAFL
ncbi:MAG: hypothetical protein WKF93_09390 [Acidimicrobiales bacterium]